MNKWNNQEDDERKVPKSNLLYGGFYRRFNFNFRFEFEYRITVLSRERIRMNFWLLKCFVWDDIFERKHPQNSPAQSFCTRPDDPTLGRMIRPHSEFQYCTSPDDLDLVTWERLVEARPDDPVLHRIIRIWEVQCVFILFCQHLGWSGVTPDDPGTTRKHTTVTFGGWGIYTPSPPSFVSLSLPEQPCL